MPKEQNVDDLLKELEKEKAERQKIEAELKEKNITEAKVKDPMSGPGVLCEVTKITQAEAWQLPVRERISTSSNTPEMIPDPVPSGYAAKDGPNNTMYIVKPGSPDLIPNCRSKFTQTYWVYGRKPAEERGNFKKEPPKVEIHLCEHHADVFQAHKIIDIDEKPTK